MRTMNFEQMESVNGGRTAAQWLGCGLGIVAVGISFAALVTATSGIGLAAAGFIIAPSAAGLSCME